MKKWMNMTKTDWTLPKPIIAQYDLTSVTIEHVNYAIAKLTEASACSSVAVARSLFQALRAGKMGKDEYRCVREGCPSITSLFVKDHHDGEIKDPISPTGSEIIDSLFFYAVNAKIGEWKF